MSHRLMRRNMRSPRNLASPPGLVDDVLRVLREQVVDERIAATARSAKDGRDIHRLLEAIMHTLDDVLSVVTAQRSRIDSLTALLSGLKKQIDDALGGQLTPSQQMRVDAIFNQAQSNTDAIDQAIDANDGDEGGDDSKLIPTATNVTSSSSASGVGDEITLSAGVLANAAVSKDTPALTGIVIFSNGGDVLGSAKLDSTGVGALSSTSFAGGSLTEGEHQITAAYRGDGLYAPSESEPLTQTVKVPEQGGGTSFGEIKANTEAKRKTGFGGKQLDGAGQINRDQIPSEAPNKASEEWPGDPNNFGRPTTQTRGTRAGLPDTPGVPNTGASAQGGSAVAPGTLTNAPGETRKVDPQGNPVLPSNTLEDVHSGEQSWTGGSALSPDGTRPASTTTDTSDPSVPDTGTMRADGGEPFLDPNRPPSPTGVDLGNDKQVGKASLDPDFMPQQGNPSVAGASNQNGDTTDKAPAMSGAGGGSADN